MSALQSQINARNRLGIAMLRGLLRGYLQLIEEDRPPTCISLVEFIENELREVRQTVQALEASGSTSTPAPAKDT